MRFFCPFALLLALLAAGCVSGNPPQRQTGSSPNLITEEDLSGFAGISAYEAIERLRGQWLRGRSGTFSAEGRNYPIVFIDGRHWGDVQTLHQIDISQVGAIRFLSASDATTRFGTGYPAGIIEVMTKRQPSPDARSAPGPSSFQGMESRGPDDGHPPLTPNPSLPSGVSRILRAVRLF